MANKTMAFEELQRRLTQAVLAALDQEVKAMLGDEGARGWTDKELPMLFRGLHPHIEAVASRINDAGEPGAAQLKIVKSSR
ncbi:hypothetical protein HA052_19570 [Chromobacterium haemolyticum]|uniref:Uncharacterized protein n=1 Tax=Chromobacterium fluminis TaxID=3044269 RepID=A0ABX0LDS4_9NEIS|nr:hypothetical protein [Chromobacterium haemolyticum]NHR07393.1 hypothetical protein [Chromobacterium haemolyticum]